MQISLICLNCYAIFKIIFGISSNYINRRWTIVWLVAGWFLIRLVNPKEEHIVSRYGLVGVKLRSPLMMNLSIELFIEFLKFLLLVFDGLCVAMIAHFTFLRVISKQIFLINQLPFLKNVQFSCSCF